MKKATFVLLALLVFSACQQNSKNTSATNADSSIYIKVKKQKPAHIAETPWTTKLDTATQKLSMAKSTLVDTSDLDLENITAALNKKYPEIKITSAKQQNDTVYVTIPNATYLTQQSGAMGAEIYLAETTYSFTQLANTSYVSFVFDEGDHASPGTFTRSDFKFSD